MIISEVVAKLSSIQEAYGDMPVVLSLNTDNTLLSDKKVVGGINYFIYTNAGGNKKLTISNHPELQEEEEIEMREALKFYKSALEDCQMPVGDLANLSMLDYYRKYGKG